MTRNSISSPFSKRIAKPRFMPRIKSPSIKVGRMPEGPMPTVSRESWLDGLTGPRRQPLGGPSMDKPSPPPMQTIRKGVHPAVYWTVVSIWLAGLVVMLILR